MLFHFWINGRVCRWRVVVKLWRKRVRFSEAPQIILLHECILCWTFIFATFIVGLLAHVFDCFTTIIVEVEKGTSLLLGGKLIEIGRLSCYCCFWCNDGTSTLRVWNLSCRNGGFICGKVLIERIKKVTKEVSSTFFTCRKILKGWWSWRSKKGLWNTAVWQRIGKWALRTCIQL